MNILARVLSALVLGAAASAALAAEPVRLVVELPVDGRVVEAGRTVDFQVVGQDPSGARVGFGDRNVELSATEGTVEVVRRPYAFRFRAPQRLERPLPVRIRAWLREAPHIRGETTVEVKAVAPYTRLVLRGATSTPPGAAVEVEVLGERADGSVVRVVDEQVTAVLSGPGRIESPSAGLFRYVAAAEGSDGSRPGSRAEIEATLQRWPEVRGRMSILVTGSSAPPARYVRLEVRGPSSLGPGERADVQVFGVGRDGRSSHVHDETVTMTLSGAGRVEPQGPGTFVYTAPSDRRQREGEVVRLDARLERLPDVRGSLAITLGRGGDDGTAPPGGEFTRLLFRGPRIAVPGQPVDLQVLGERADGTVTPIVDDALVANLAGPGRLESAGAGRYRYHPPADGADQIRSSGSAWIVVLLDRRPFPRGEHEISLSPWRKLVIRAPATVRPEGSIDLEVFAERPDGRSVPIGSDAVLWNVVGGGRVDPVRSGWYRYTAPTRDERPRGGNVWIAARLERQPGVRGDLDIAIGRGGPFDDDVDDTPDAGVVWSGGHVRVSKWRSREAEEHPWTRKRSLPSPGASFSTAFPYQRVNVVPVRDDVVRYETDSWIGGRRGAPVRSDERTENAAVRLLRNPQGELVLDVTTPDRPIYVDLLLTLRNGKVVREEFVFSR